MRIKLYDYRRRVTSFLKSVYSILFVLISYKIFAGFANEILPIYKILDDAIIELNRLIEMLNKVVETGLNEENSFAAQAEFIKNWQTTFANPGTLGLESIHIFHSDLWLILGTIFFTVAYIGIETIIRFDAKKITKKSKNAELIEFIWTILPILIVLLIVVPSFSLSHILNTPPTEVVDLPSVSVNVTGNQWFWQYEVDVSNILDYLDLSPELLEKHAQILSKPIQLDAYMLPTVDLEPGDLRGLAATNKLTIPAGVEVKVFGNSRDVIHSWAVNGFDIKMDAVPGRVNSASFNPTTVGTYNGQCSEVCGPGHGFMPIVVDVVEMDKYTVWVENVLNFRASYSGISGLLKYGPGNYGQSTRFYEYYPEKLLDLEDQSLKAEWTRKLYTRQAQILQRHRLINYFKEIFGMEVNRDESHLLLEPKHWILDIGETSPTEETVQVDKYLFEEYCDNRARNGKAKKNWILEYLRRIEPNYISNNYSITLPSAMSFVSCKNQWYGPNFNSYDNDDGNIWYFEWYLSSLWIDNKEYQLLLDFPQNIGIKGESVLPVLPTAYVDPSEHAGSLCNFEQELGYRFLTKKIKTWTTHETPTVLVQGFSGKIKDTGVPIDELWCAKFRFVSTPPPKNLWLRHSPKL